MIAAAAAVAAFAAVWLWCDTGAAQIRRLGRGSSRVMPSWLRGRPDALPATRRSVFALCAGLVALVLSPGLGGVVIGAIVGGGAYVGLGFLETGAGRRLRLVQTAQLPMALEFMAAALTAGAPLARATRDVAGVSPRATSEVLNAVVARSSIGATDAESWVQLRDHAVWGDIARDIARSAESGTALTATLRAHANSARRRHRESLEAQAKRVGVKVALPLMCCFLPAFLAIGVAPVVIGLMGSYLGF